MPDLLSRLRPRLIAEWHAVLVRAWSIRLMLVAGLLSGIEAVLPFLYDVLPIGPRLFAAIYFVVVVAALIARLLPQKNLGD